MSKSENKISTDKNIIDDKTEPSSSSMESDRRNNQSINDVITKDGFDINNVKTLAETAPWIDGTQIHMDEWKQSQADAKGFFSSETVTDTTTESVSKKEEPSSKNENVKKA